MIICPYYSWELALNISSTCQPVRLKTGKEYERKRMELITTKGCIKKNIRLLVEFSAGITVVMTKYKIINTSRHAEGIRGNEINTRGKKRRRGCV